MNELMRKYLELTEIDHGIVEARAQLARIPGLLEQMTRLETEEQEKIAEARKLLDKARHDRRQAEKEVETLRERAKKYGSQQAQVKTNKEYEAITHEIGLIHGQIDAADELGLEALEAEEQAARDMAQSERDLAALRAEHEGERARLQAQRVEKSDRLERLQSERTRRLAELPDGAREDYELLNERYPGSVAAPVRHGQCGGCNWALVPATIQQAHAGNKPTQCEHCRRFLYAPA